MRSHPLKETLALGGAANSLVYMNVTRKFVTNYATVRGNRGPIGQIIKLRTPPGPREIELIRIGNHRR
jgi:hypothetical protein